MTPPKRVTDQLQSVTLPKGLKVWPVKVQKNSPTRYFAAKFQEMQDDFTAVRFCEIPVTEKFSKFIEQNTKSNRAFCMALFSDSVQDPDDPPNTLTVGFVFDAMKATNIQTHSTNITDLVGSGAIHKN